MDEECSAWRKELEWDFDKSADLVRRFVDMSALNGSALLEDGDVAGYMYYVLEEDKGLIGDLYVRQALRTVERENLLINSALEAVMGCPAVRRIESPAHDAAPQPGAPDAAPGLPERLRAQLHAHRPDEAPRWGRAMCGGRCMWKSGATITKMRQRS